MDSGARLVYSIFWACLGRDMVNKSHEELLLEACAKNASLFCILPTSSAFSAQTRGLDILEIEYV